MLVRGFLIPQDIPLLWVIPAETFYFAYLAPLHAPNVLIRRLRAKNHHRDRRRCDPIRQLTLIYRLAGYLLRRPMHRSRPCLIRSLVVFDQAIKRGLPAEIVIAAKKDAAAGLTGHSWIEIGGQAFMENIIDLQQYTEMIRG